MQEREKKLIMAGDMEHKGKTYVILGEPEKKMTGEERERTQRKIVMPITLDYFSNKFLVLGHKAKMNYTFPTYYFYS